MDTYVNNSVIYFEALGRALQAIPLSKLGVGFESMQGDLTLSYPALQARLADMVLLGGPEIDIWMTPLPSDWWPALAAYAAGSGPAAAERLN